MKVEALAIQRKLINNDTLTYEDRTFLIGFIIFALEFQEYIKTAHHRDVQGAKTNGTRQFTGD